MTSAQEILVGSDWLAEHLDAPELCIVDSSVVMTRQAAGQWMASSGRANYDAAHIPGARFVDLLVDLHDLDSPYRHMLPPADRFAAGVGALGISNDSFVVVYASAVPWWATRFWWMLRAFGHDRVAVLNGGLKKWQAEGRALETDPPAVVPATFVPHYRAERVADKAQVQAALDNASANVINALSPQLFTGESNLGYARPGRIAGSVNLSALALVDPETGLYLPAEQLREAVDLKLDAGRQEQICYCGGGIAATMDAFVLALVGHDRVAVYDGSLEEWSADETRAMETGEIMP